MEHAEMPPGMEPRRAATRPSLPHDALRLPCPPETIPFESTASVEPLQGVIGQDAAMEALRFGLQINAPGQNVFVRGLTGTGRMTLVSRLLQETRLDCSACPDRCYVHCFADPHRPRLLTLPRGRASVFRGRIDELTAFILHELDTALESEGLRTRTEALERESQREIDRLVNPLEEELSEAGLSLVNIQIGPILRAAMLPRLDGKPVPPEQWEQLQSEGKVSQDQVEQLRKRRDAMEPRLRETMERVNVIRRDLAERIRSLREAAARSILNELVGKIIADWPQEAVRAYLAELVDHAVTAPDRKPKEDSGDHRYYRVNVLLTRPPTEDCPIIVEDTPTVKNLLGTVDFGWERDRAGATNHMLIRAGSLLRADGGYLILDARDLLREPGAWHMLVRTLRTGRLEIMPGDLYFAGWGPQLKPEPIAVNLKVLLLGDAETYQILDRFDPDFPHLFKVLADFDSVMPRNGAAIAQYGGVIARIVKEYDHPQFDRSGLAALVEHGSRIAGRQDRLTTRFGRLVDIAHEAAFIARREGHTEVTAAHVRAGIRRSRARAGLPSKRFQELLADGTIRICTEGAAVGQVNGLAVSHMGPLTFGFPTRITATIGPGTAGVINIEREAELSGSIHTKGFYILGGLLRYLLRTVHPLAFHAAIAFEQSYGGIDGDSASAAEICCLLSALTDIPLRQDLAITGAIDQVGNVLPVGAANEKIEGFFDTCRQGRGIGSHGVIIPQGNARDLMLREDVIQACQAGRFHVYAIDRIHDALELLSGVVAGEPDGEGGYPDDSLLGISVARAFEYWVKASQTAGPIQWTDEAPGDPDVVD